MVLFDVIRRALMVGLGMQETVKEFIDELVRKGELSESQGAKLVKEWSETAGKSSAAMGQNMSDMIASAIKKMNLATREDIERLNREMHTISERLAKVETSAGSFPEENAL